MSKYDTLFDFDSKRKYYKCRECSAQLKKYKTSSTASRKMHLENLHPEIHNEDGEEEHQPSTCRNNQKKRDSPKKKRMKTFLPKRSLRLAGLDPLRLDEESAGSSSKVSERKEKETITPKKDEEKTKKNKRKTMPSIDKVDEVIAGNAAKDKQSSKKKKISVQQPRNSSILVGQDPENLKNEKNNQSDVPTKGLGRQRSCFSVKKKEVVETSKRMKTIFLEEKNKEVRKTKSKKLQNQSESSKMKKRTLVEEEDLILQTPNVCRRSSSNETNLEISFIHLTGDITEELKAKFESKREEIKKSRRSSTSSQPTFLSSPFDIENGDSMEKTVKPQKTRALPEKAIEILSRSMEAEAEWKRSIERQKAWKKKQFEQKVEEENKQNELRENVEEVKRKLEEERKKKYDYSREELSKLNKKRKEEGRTMINQSRKSVPHNFRPCSSPPLPLPRCFVEDSIDMMDIDTIFPLNSSHTARSFQPPEIQDVREEVEVILEQPAAQPTLVSKIEGQFSSFSGIPRSNGQGFSNSNKVGKAPWSTRRNKKKGNEPQQKHSNSNVIYSALLRPSFREQAMQYFREDLTYRQSTLAPHSTTCPTTAAQTPFGYQKFQACHFIMPIQLGYERKNSAPTSHFSYQAHNKLEFGQQNWMLHPGIHSTPVRASRVSSSVPSSRHIDVFKTPQMSIFSWHAIQSEIPQNYHLTPTMTAPQQAPALLPKLNFSTPNKSSDVDDVLCQIQPGCEPERL